MDNSKTTIMHEAARRVLAKHESIGEPFALFLSSWSFDQTRSTYFEILGKIGLGDRSTREVQARIGLERQVRILLKRAGLETVAVYRQGDDQRIAVPEEWPALTLDDDDWRTAVADAVGRADLITLFWGSTTAGVAEEMELCSSGTTPLKTVIVVPAAPLAIWQSQVHKTFPRVVPLEEIPPLFALHPEFDPLIERMRSIMSLDPAVRSGMVDPQERLRRYPLPPVSGRFDRDLWIEF
jgi:hypothetical protein